MFAIRSTRSAGGAARKESSMYATVRRYTPKGAVEKKTIDDLKRRIDSKFVPIVQDVRGFHSYYVLATGKNELVTIGIFEDKTGATESTRRAAEFVKNDPDKDRLGTPEIYEGELLVTKEGAVAAR
jgi:hypothetical protein